MLVGSSGTPQRDPISYFNGSGGITLYILSGRNDNLYVYKYAYILGGGMRFLYLLFVGSSGTPQWDSINYFWWQQ